MYESDSEAVNSQRRRRKRIARMKKGIIAIAAGWFFLSLVLIICLFIKLCHLEKRLNQLDSDIEKNVSKEVPTADSVAEGLEKATEEQIDLPEDYEPAIPVASGIDDTLNRAQDGDRHKVYLTFNDSPSENTAEILDILKEYDIKATFFVVGKEDEQSKALYQRIVAEGHTLGMHSYSNKYNTIYQSDEAFEEDFHKLRNYLYEVTGIEVLYYRFPGGSSNSISNVPMKDLIHYLNQQGVIYYDWNVSFEEIVSDTYSIDEMVADVANDVVKYKTSVVLLYDTEDRNLTAEALGPLIETLNEMGAEILPIDKDTSVIQYVKADMIK